ncbi:MAG TPA: class I SAM-dependent methyltransferase [Candidatus Ozemobacteraceae bacterium]|nr:class I SAM-dependent methyltransferase [Candidatus Ozemobacteraceae bacterium]
MHSASTVQHAYDRYSTLYDLFFKPWLEDGHRIAVEQLDLCPGQTVLEVGVGTGLSLEYYPSQVSVVGFDFSHGMLCQSQKRAEECSCPTHLLRMDVSKMAFPTRTFDRILAAYVLTVVPDTRSAIGEILRVAKPGAKVVMINHLRSRNPVLSWIEDRFHPVFSKLGLFTLDRDLLSILESCGIRDYTLTPTTFLGLHHVISFTVPEHF